MTKETRQQATERVTCQAAAWLWHARGCRALAREVGLAPGGSLCRPWDGRWRLDLAGLAHAKTHVTALGIEVKGTREDLVRESLARGKWPDVLGRDLELWLAVGDQASALAAVERLPWHWGLVLFTADMVLAPKVIRQARAGRRHGPDSPWVTGAWRALAQVATSSQLPAAFGNAQHPHGRPWRRLVAEAWHQPLSDEDHWARDPDQMSLPFGDDETTQPQGDVHAQDHQVQDAVGDHTGAERPARQSRRGRGQRRRSRGRAVRHVSVRRQPGGDDL